MSVWNGWRRVKTTALVAVAVGSVATGAAGLAGESAAAASGAPALSATDVVKPDSVLVVGDSIVSQADNQTRSSAPAGARVWVAAGPGSAPCDWNAGYRDPFTGAWDQFSRLVDRYHPGAVVLSFSGNPGLSGPGSGCVDANTHYSLGALLTTYRRALGSMARYATGHGALVYFAGAPPRNPRTPAGAYRGTGGSRLYGFNGVGQLNQLFTALAGSAEGQADRWRYDPAAAAAVSDPSLNWHLTESCALWDYTAGHCGSDGQVRVRTGGYDAIHLDPAGAGATRYGMAIVRQPLSDEGYPA